MLGERLTSARQAFATRKHTPVTTWCWESENFFIDELIGSVAVSIQPTLLTNHLSSALRQKLGPDFERALATFERRQLEGGAFAADLVTDLKRFIGHLDLQGCWISDEGAGRLAAVLGQCASLAHLDLQENGIGDEGAGRLAVVLGQCASLAHLDLRYNGIGAEGAGRLDSVAKHCPSLTISAK